MYACSGCNCSITPTPSIIGLKKESEVLGKATEWESCPYAKPGRIKRGRRASCGWGSEDVGHAREMGMGSDAEGQAEERSETVGRAGLG